MDTLQSKFQEANELHRQKKYREAIIVYNAVIGNLKKQPNSTSKTQNLATLYLNLGNSLKEDEQFVKAKKNFKKALKGFNALHKKGTDCRKFIAWTYNNIGSMHLENREFPQALRCNKKALVLRRNLYEQYGDNYKIDFLMSLYNYAISTQYESDFDLYAKSLKEFISTYDDFDNLNPLDMESKKHYEDAQSRLKRLQDPNFRKLKRKDDFESDLEDFIKRYHGVEPTPKQALKIEQEFRDITGASIISTQKRDGLEQFYFRVRSKSSMKAGDENHPNQFNHPPPEFTKYGRVNLAKHPVFYGGERIDVVVQETHIKENELFYLSVWRSGSNYPKYAIMHSDHVKSKRLRLHKGTRNERYKDFIIGFPDWIYESMDYIFNTLSELFTIDDWVISSSLGYNLLYNKEDIDGIEYPDVKTRTSYNFALKPEFASKLILHKVFLCCLKNGEVNFLETGNLNGGLVEYQTYKEEHHPYLDKELRIVKEESE